VLLVYNNLLKGSRNHLRGFTSALEAIGESYYAQILEEDYFDEIVNSEMENGGGMNGEGNHLGEGIGYGHGSGNGYKGGNGSGRGDGTGPQDGTCNG